MNTVQMTKSNLISILEENMKIHVEEYNKALKGWQDEYLDKLKDHAEIVMGGRWDGDDTFYFTQPKPQSYEESYEDAISQLTHDIRETIELTQKEYRQYVLDKWNWKTDFITSNSKYLT